VKAKSVTCNENQSGRINGCRIPRRPGMARWLLLSSIDDWLFNFGPNEFQYQLILENGRVTRIDSLDYGY